MPNFITIVTTKIKLNAVATGLYPVVTGIGDVQRRRYKSETLNK